MVRVDASAIIAAISCWLVAGFVPITSAHADCPSNRLFLPASTYGITNHPLVLIARDINGDGIQDLVMSVADFVGSAGRITVRLGSGSGGAWDGSFQPDANYAIGLRPGAIIMADFDKDGIQDLAGLSMEEGTLRILMGLGTSGTGDGTFSDPVSFPTAAYASHLAAADFNQDGVLDLAVLISTPAKLLVLLGGGTGGVWNGTFGAPQTEFLFPGSQPSRIIVGNFNGDGIADLAVLESTPSHLAILIGSGIGGIGNGDFAAPVEYPVGIFSSSTRDFVAADVNSDNINDIIVANSRTIVSFFGNGSGGVGDGTFAPGVSTLSFSAGAIVLGDFNRDEILDVAAVGGGIVVVHPGGGVGGVGDGSFLPPTGYRVGDNSTSIAITDLNGDSLPDLAVADSYSDQISILIAGCPPLLAPNTGVWADGGVPVCTAPGEQTEVRIVPDGAGGACLAWRDMRSGTGTDVYTTRLDGEGQPVAGWVTEGNPACTNPANQGSVRLIPDGAGGLIVAWLDFRDGYQAIYAQHMLGDGTVAPGWPLDGLRVGPMSSQPTFDMDSDGAGGALFGWIDVGSEGYQRVFCQRLTGSGSVSPGWPSDGLGVIPGSGQSSLSGLTIASDAAGGVFLAWDSYYQCSGHGCPPNPLFRSVAHAKAGAVTWNIGSQRSSNGYPFPQLISDGAGGVIYTSNDSRDGYSRIDAAGTTIWTIANNAYPCTDTRRLIRSGDGGCYSLWSCYGQEGVEAFATRLTHAGSVAPGWIVDGRTINAGPGDQFIAGGAEDGIGGAFFAILDSRSGLSNVHAVHIGPDGAPSPGWSPIGRIVCDAPGGQFSAAIAKSDPGSSIVAWEDGRNGLPDIYAQKLSRETPVAAAVSLVSAKADPSAAHLIWQVREGSPGRGFVQRGSDGEEWAEIGQCFADGLGWMRFDDRDVVPGRRYGYRLEVAEGGTRVSSEEAWLTIPAAYTLALERTQPNPVFEDVEVGFTLSSSLPAAIELVDLAGRRVVARSVGEMGAGRHVVQIASRGSLPPGIYFLRLVQDGKTLTSRICVLQ